MGGGGQKVITVVFIRENVDDYGWPYVAYGILIICHISILSHCMQSFFKRKSL